MTAKGGKAHITLATGTKADPRGAYHISTIQQLLEELPRGNGIGGTHPDIGGILSAIDLKAELSEGGKHLVSIVHVIVYRLLYLLATVRSVDSLCGTLRDIVGAIELGALSAVP